MIKGSRIQGTKDSELPSRSKADVATRAADIPAADSQAARAESAENDTSAVRNHRRSPDVDVFEQTLAGSQVVANDGVGHYLGCGHFVVLTE